MSTALSGSTRGGTTYDILCSGEVKSYSFNLVDLNDCQPLSLETATNALIKQIDDTLTNIAIQQPDKELVAFTIGKSHARQKFRKKSGGYGRTLIKFDRKDPKTWKFDGGINNRWREYLQKGYSGLIALTAVTRSVIPYNVRQAHGQTIDVEQYSIALEQQLIQHYMLKKADSRLENTSFHPGNLCDKAKKPYAGIVYVAFKLNDTEYDEQSDAADNEDGTPENISSRILRSDSFSSQKTKTDSTKKPTDGAHASHMEPSDSFVAASEDHYSTDSQRKRISPRNLARLNSQDDQCQEDKTKQKRVTFAKSPHIAGSPKSILKRRTDKPASQTLTTAPVVQSDNSSKSVPPQCHKQDNTKSAAPLPKTSKAKSSSRIDYEHDSRETFAQEDQQSASRDAQLGLLPAKRKHIGDEKKTRTEKQTCPDVIMIDVSDEEREQRPGCSHENDFPGQRLPASDITDTDEQLSGSIREQRTNSVEIIYEKTVDVLSQEVDEQQGKHNEDNTIQPEIGNDVTLCTVDTVNGNKKPSQKTKKPKSRPKSQSKTSRDQWKPLAATYEPTSSKTSGLGNRRTLYTCSWCSKQFKCRVKCKEHEETHKQWKPGF